PTSMMSAPSATARCRASIAVASSAWRLPLQNESRVRLMTAITPGAAGEISRPRNRSGLAPGGTAGRSWPDTDGTLWRGPLRHRRASAPSGDSARLGGTLAGVAPPRDAHTHHGPGDTDPVEGHGSEQVEADAEEERSERGDGRRPADHAAGLPTLEDHRHLL